MQNKYLKFEQICKEYPIFSKAGWRNLIFTNKNNIQKSILKVGHKLIFDVKEFEAWLDSNKMQK